MSRNNGRHGLTLMELIIASVLGVLVIIALGQVDVTRLLTVERVRDNSESYQEGLFAMNHMLKELEGADKIELAGPTSVQFRIPTVVPGTPPTFTFTWHQFRYDAGAGVLWFYPNNACGAGRKVARNLSGVTFAYTNVSPTPSGGEPLGAGVPGGIANLAPGEDSNVLQLEVQVPEPATGTLRALRQKVTIRAAGYTATAINGLDPGGPLAPALCL